ncbi:MAG TPA: glycosyltransferase [Steroidobacteraceae bacterium]|nr:glycosyltransferase [Steroidobacteraceae bacterium]
MSATSAEAEGIAAPPRIAQPGQPLRVLQIISSVAAVNGGASTAMWSTLKALQNRNVHSELVTTNEDGLHKLMDVPFGGFVRCGGHRVRYFPARGDRYTTSWPLARWLLAHVRDYDVVHVHGLFRFAPVVAAHTALLRGVPYVLTLHNTLGEWGLRNRRRILKRLSIGLIEGRMIDGASIVHLCSCDELSQVTQVRRLGERSRVFPLGVDVSPAADGAPDEDVAKHLERLAGRSVVLFLSRIHEIKGVDRLLEAFAAVRRARPDAILAIAGTGSPQLVAGLREQARRLGIADSTMWLGFVQGQQKQQLFASAQVFVLPSHSENFGYAVVEAMEAGLPVITTRNVPAGQFVLDANAGIVYDGSTAQLQQGILKILEMPEDQRRALRTRAAGEIHDRLSLRSYGDALEETYREAASVCPLQRLR